MVEDHLLRYTKNSASMRTKENIIRRKFLEEMHIYLTRTENVKDHQKYDIKPKHKRVGTSVL